jgi:hypothetical protein
MLNQDLYGVSDDSVVEIHAALGLDFGDKRDVATTPERQAAGGLSSRHPAQDHAEGADAKEHETCTHIGILFFRRLRLRQIAVVAANNRTHSKRTKSCGMTQ